MTSIVQSNRKTGQKKNRGLTAHIMDMTESNPRVRRLRLMGEVDEQPRRLLFHPAMQHCTHKISLIFEFFQKLEAVNGVVTIGEQSSPQTFIVEAVGVQLQL